MIFFVSFGLRFGINVAYNSAFGYGLESVWTWAPRTRLCADDVLWASVMCVSRRRKAERAARLATFSSPREHRILVWFSSSIQRMPVCESFAWCPQQTTSRRSGFCVGPQHRLLVGAHAGCSVVPCPFLRRGFIIEQKGYNFKQNGVYL